MYIIKRQLAFSPFAHEIYVSVKVLFIRFEQCSNLIKTVMLIV